MRIPKEETTHVFGLICGVTLATVFIYTLLFYSYMINAPLCKGNASALVTLKKGEPVRDFLKELGKRGIHVNPYLFLLYIKLTGHSKDLRAGEYMVSTSQSVRGLAKELVEGRVYLRSVTVWEGMSMFDIADLLVQQGLLAHRDEFLSAASDPVLLRKLKVPGCTAEGFLFPETYRFPKGFPASRIVEKMVYTFWQRVGNDIIKECHQRGLTLLQAVILASIIQKETSIREEMPLISAVYHNRLKRGMRLQADPTVIYAVRLQNGGYKTTLGKRELRIRSPYNTYLHKGLPPGPICNPGLDAIRAAIYPAHVKYLYFVARGDGTHVFSRTLAAHNKAVAHYIEVLRKRRVLLMQPPAP